jgi:hypothetical protein
MLKKSKKVQKKTIRVNFGCNTSRKTVGKKMVKYDTDVRVF